MLYLIITLLFGFLALISYLLRTTLTEYFVFLGASDILPQLFYIIYTAIALFISIYGCDALIISGKEKDIYLSFPVSPFSLIIAKILPTYLINLIIAFFTVFVPLLSDIKDVGFIFLLALTFVLPLFPMALSTLWVYFKSLFPKTDTKPLKLINATVFLAFLVLLTIIGSRCFNLLKDNAYQLTASISKYYFPAVFFSSTVKQSSFADFVTLTTLSVAAFYIYLYVLKKINKL